MKTPGQIAYETFKDRILLWIGLTAESRSAWEAAAQAVLSSQWRSVDDPPEDKSQTVLWANQGRGRYTGSFRGSHSSYTHWMSIPALPKPTDEQKSRSEFEAFWDLPSRPCLLKEDARVFWEAGRKSKEGQKP